MNFKSLLPFENYILTTNLSVDEVLKRLNENIEHKKSFSFSLFGTKFTKSYTGQIIGTSFKMERNINYRNSFLSQILGQISSGFGQTQVHIKMRLEISVLIFMSIWLGIAGFMCIMIAIFCISDGIFPFPIILPLPFFAFGYLITYFGFKTESKKSKEFLAQLLEGDEKI